MERGAAVLDAAHVPAGSTLVHVEPDRAAMLEELRTLRAHSTALQIALRVVLEYLPAEAKESLLAGAGHARELGLSTSMTDEQLAEVCRVIEVLAGRNLRLLD